MRIKHGKTGIQDTLYLLSCSVCNEYTLCMDIIKLQIRKKTITTFNQAVGEAEEDGEGVAESDSRTAGWLAKPNGIEAMTTITRSI